MEAVVRTYNGESSVRKRIIKGGRRGVRCRAAGFAAALLVAAGLSMQHTGRAMAKPHPHVDKPASVAAATLPTETVPSKHEVVTGGDLGGNNKSVNHWTVATNPAVNIGNYKKTHQ